MNHPKPDRETIKDERNRRFILRAQRNLFAYGLHPNPTALAYEGTPEERATFVRKASQRFLVGIALVTLAISIPWARSGKSPLAESEPSFILAGSIISVVLNESTFTTTSTVTTDAGVFQVSGAVTASIGNQAKVKSWSAGSVEHKALCIESSFKPDCYTLR